MRWHSRRRRLIGRRLWTDGLTWFVQRWVLHEILDAAPPHVAAHGFTRGRSALTHAAVHTGRAVVLRIDLRDFFASVSAARVYGIFSMLGYNRSLAHTLTGLCSNTIPTTVWNAADRPQQPHLIQPHFWLGRALATPHLPQGAPTSPALANLAAFGLDRRLSGLGSAFDLTYSRYADDLVFSGQRLSHRANQIVLEMAGRIVDEEGFRINQDKSSLRTAAQRQLVAGPPPDDGSTRRGPTQSLAAEPPWQTTSRRRRYGAAIFLHSAWAECLSEEIGIFPAAVRQACSALWSAALTFALLVLM